MYRPHENYNAEGVLNGTATIRAKMGHIGCVARLRILISEILIMMTKISAGAGLL